MVNSVTRAIVDAPEADGLDKEGGRLTDRVYGQLLEFIVEQDLDRGDRLPSEVDLCRMTAASRPIVREALMRLQADGLIESRRGSGSYVRQRPAKRQIQHLRPAAAQARLASFEVRIALEPVAARLAALHRSERDMQAIKGALDALIGSHAESEPAGDHDLAFHRAIAEASHNPMFLVMLDALDARVEGLIVPSLALVSEGAADRADRVEREHIAVFEAIERGDAECAEAAMRLHLLSAHGRASNMRW